MHIPSSGIFQTHLSKPRQRPPCGCSRAPARPGIPRGPARVLGIPPHPGGWGRARGRRRRCRGLSRRGRTAAGGTRRRRQKCPSHRHTPSPMSPPAPAPHGPRSGSGRPPAAAVWDLRDAPGRVSWCHPRIPKNGYRDVTRPPTLTWSHRGVPCRSAGRFRCSCRDCGEKGQRDEELSPRRIPSLEGCIPNTPKWGQEDSPSCEWHSGNPTGLWQSGHGAAASQKSIPVCPRMFL